MHISFPHPRGESVPVRSPRLYRPVLGCAGEWPARDLERFDFTYTPGCCTTLIMELHVKSVVFLNCIVIPSATFEFLVQQVLD